MHFKFFFSEYLDYRVEEWVSSLDKYLSEISQEQFGEYRDSLIHTKTEKPKNLTEEKDKLATEIKENTFKFDRRFLEAKELESVTLKDVVCLYETYLKKGAPKRRKLSSWINSSVETEPRETPPHGMTEITDINIFKNLHKLYPSLIN